MTEIFLYDSAEIQCYDVHLINRKHAVNNLPLFDPLYSSEDVKKSMELVDTVQYETEIEPLQGVKPFSQIPGT